MLAHALPQVQRCSSFARSGRGPIGIYPEAERKDYIAVHKDASEPDHVSPQEFVAKAKDPVGRGVQIVGGCCGIELEHIRPLREALP